MKTPKIAVLFAIIAALGLFACAPAAPTPPPKAAAPPAAKGPADQSQRHEQLVEAAKKEGELVVWTYSMLDEESVTAPFKAKYPFLKVTVFDSTGDELLARLSQEFPAGKYSADVLYLSAESFEAQKLGVFDSYEFTNAKDWPNQVPGSLYRKWAGNARVVTYNTNKVAAADVPKRHEDLLDAKYQKYKMILTTSGEDTPAFYASMWGAGKEFNWQKSEQYWQELVRVQKPAIQRGYTAPLELLGAGEFDIFPAATLSSTLRLMDKGAPLAVAPIPEAPAQIESSIALMKNAPHPNAARLWLDFYTTPEGVAAYAGGNRFIAIQGGEYDRLTPTNAQLGKLGINFIWQSPDLSMEEAYERSSQFWFERLGIKR